MKKSRYDKTIHPTTEVGGLSCFLFRKNLTKTLEEIFGIPYALLNTYTSRYFHSTMKWSLLSSIGNYTLMRDEIEDILKLKSIPFEKYIS